MKRSRVMREVASLLRDNPIVALVGPRQVGKTTLADALAAGLRPRPSSVVRFDLEDPLDLARLDNPRLALEPLDGLVIIDEIQRRPDLFPLLRVLADRGPKRRRFLILGSASGDLLRQASETLAGRIAFYELTPFLQAEVKAHDRLWLRGGFPRSFLARSDSASFVWLKNYVATFLERDVPSFGLRIAPTALRRFWMMSAHCHGQVVNLSQLGRSLGASDKTVRHYLDVLTQTFMLRQLQPWHQNIAKRQVRSPKLYFRDSGLLHHLLGIDSQRALHAHPSYGASWEGFAIEQLLRELAVPPESCFFWATHADAELDLLTFIGGRRIGFEIKASDAPKVTKSMRIALADLALDQLFVVYPGRDEFPMDDRVHALGLEALSSPNAKFRTLISP